MLHKFVLDPPRSCFVLCRATQKLLDYHDDDDVDANDDTCAGVRPAGTQANSSMPQPLSSSEVDGAPAIAPPPAPPLVPPTASPST